jgi:hypothetical protein
MRARSLAPTSRDVLGPETSSSLKHVSTRLGGLAHPAFWVANMFEVRRPRSKVWVIQGIGPVSLYRTGNNR